MHGEIVHVSKIVSKHVLIWELLYSNNVKYFFGKNRSGGEVFFNEIKMFILQALFAIAY